MSKRPKKNNKNRPTSQATSPVVPLVMSEYLEERRALPIEGKLSLTVVASAAGLKTDLSGLELVQDEDLRDRLMVLGRSMKRTLVNMKISTTLQVKDEPWRPDNRRTQSAVSSTGTKESA